MVARGGAVSGYYRIDADAVAKKRYAKATEELTESELLEYLGWLATEVHSAILGGARYVRVYAASDVLAQMLAAAVERRLCRNDERRVYACQKSYYTHATGLVHQCGAAANCYIAPLTYHMVVRRDVGIEDVLSYLRIIDAVAVDVATPSGAYAMILRITLGSREEEQVEQVPAQQQLAVGQEA